MKNKKILVIPLMLIVIAVFALLVRNGVSQTTAAVILDIKSDGNTGKSDSGRAAPALTLVPSSAPSTEPTASPAAPMTGGAENTEPDGMELAAYKGPVRHIFFHPLIIHPEKAFKAGSLSEGFNDWFVTVPEFRRILESIYNNNYILVSMDDVCSVEEQNGVVAVKRRELKLPRGKKPLVISIDDMNYYDYMLENGCASRLFADRQGHMGVESIGKDGSSEYSYDDVVPMVDEFVRKHPDFSFKGAKGIIALTGYQGILGYRTNNSVSTEYDADKNQAVMHVNMLKEEGWKFACHGFGHLNAEKVGFDRLKKDCERWVKEVEPLIGKTSIYIYPYGCALKFSDEKFKLLKAFGFNIFCGVGPDGYIEYKGDFAYLERKSVDGLSMLSNSPYLKELFDSKSVLDPARPKLK